MSNKDYGTGVSGYLDPTGRNWELAVYQRAKPVLDKELNLSEDLGSFSTQNLLRKIIPSGWFCDDALWTPASSPLLQGAVGTSISTVGRMAHVNGWFLNVEGARLDLGVAPQAGSRVDLVILEVWRRLITVSPTDQGKDASINPGLIWANGNVKHTPGNNLPDDMVDPIIGVETTRRVQIQYRLRVVHTVNDQGVDIMSYPYGIDDPHVFANTIPVTWDAPDGVSSVFPYANQCVEGDPGLWVAGDGTPSNALGTVDGYMYALPMMAIFRRNSGAYDVSVNPCGTTPSRPDGLTGLVVDRDVHDLRCAVSLKGWNYQEVLEKGMDALLENSLQTEWFLDSGMTGHTVLRAEHVGVVGCKEFFDSVRMDFSDRPVSQIVTVSVGAPNGGWQLGSSVDIELGDLAIYPSMTGVDWLGSAGNVVISSVVDAWWLGMAQGEVTMLALPLMSFVPVGSPLDHVTATVSMPLPLIIVGSSQPLFVDLEVTYSRGRVLGMTPTQTFSSTVDNSGLIPDFGAIVTSFDPVHRGVNLSYTTSLQTLQIVSDSSDVIHMPEIVTGTPTVVGPPPGSIVYTASAHGRKIDLGAYPAAGDLLTVTYTAVRPFPIGVTGGLTGVRVFYEARSPQALRVQNLPTPGTTVSILPRWVSPNLYVLSVGSGSTDEAYPHPLAYVQTGGVPAWLFDGEWKLDSSSHIGVTGFNSDTGYIKLPAYMGYEPGADPIVFGRQQSDIDEENRSYFSSASSDGGYLPNAYGPTLLMPCRHKVCLPIVGELTIRPDIGQISGTGIGQQGQLVLILLTRWAESDMVSGVFFDPDPNSTTTVASIFRIPCSPLNWSA